MAKVKLTVVKANCRCCYHIEGDEFVVEDLCPPICHELWNSMYPFIYALQNGAMLDYGDERAPMFDVKCPDDGRVVIHGEIMK